MKKSLIVILHAFVLWALCGGTIAIGRGLVGIKTTLIIHALAAPAFAALISFFYFKKYHFTTALPTALIFLAIVVALDAGLVAPVFEKSYAMFRSFLGTWLPFGSIFLATFFTGLLLRRRNAKR
jgi:hypothetical protein